MSERQQTDHEKASELVDYLGKALTNLGNITLPLVYANQQLQEVTEHSPKSIFERQEIDELIEETVISIDAFANHIIRNYGVELYVTHPESGERAKFNLIQYSPFGYSATLRGDEAESWPVLRPDQITFEPLPRAQGII